MVNTVNDEEDLVLDVRSSSSSCSDSQCSQSFAPDSRGQPCESESDEIEKQNRRKKLRNLTLAMRNSRKTKKTRNNIANESVDPVLTIQRLKKVNDKRCVQCPMVDEWLMDTGCGYERVSASHVQNMGRHLENAKSTLLFSHSQWTDPDLRSCSVEGA